MELKNANPNGCNVVKINLHPMIIFFSFIFELNKIKDFKVYFRIENP